VIDGEHLTRFRVRNIAEVATAVASATFRAKITVDVRGEISNSKSAINNNGVRSCDPLLPKLPTPAWIARSAPTEKLGDSVVRVVAGT